MNDYFADEFSMGGDHIGVSGHDSCGNTWVSLSQVKDLPGYKEAKGGMKLDDGKNPLALLPFEAVEEVGKVLQFGAKKYAAHNWRAGFAYSRLISAALRHIFAFARGESNDPESGLSHLAHAACCVLFLLTFVLTKTGTDDRHTS